MKWHYSGEITVHHLDGSMDIEQVDTVVDLPDPNVEMIRNFLYANRSLILGYKYNPPSGEAPWGDVASQSELHRTLASRMSDDEWAAGVTDKQSDTPSKAGGLMNVTAPRAGVLAEGICESIRIVHFGQTLPALGYNDARPPLQIQRLRRHSPAPRNSPPHALRCLPLNRRAIAMALFPLRNPITDDTACFGGIAIHICT